MAKVVTDSIYYQTIAELLRAEAYSEELTQKRYKPSEMAGGVTRVADENRASGMKMGETIGETRVFNAIKRCFEDRNYAPPDAVVDAYALTNGAMINEFSKGRREGKQEEYDRFWDSYQQNGSRANYCYAFAGPCWTKETLKLKYPIKIVDTSTVSRRCMHMFTYFNSGGAKPFDMTEVCSKIDFSEALSIQNLFANAAAKNITVDASKAINCTGAFLTADGGNLNNIVLTVSNACTYFTNTFNNNITLTDLTITPGSKIAASIDLHWSPLTKDSIDSVYAALSETATGKTASFNKKAVNAAYTTDEWNALVAQKSNWTFTLV